jgi:hypothetical protein
MSARRPEVGFWEAFVGRPDGFVPNSMNGMLFPDVDGSWCSVNG